MASHPICVNVALDILDALKGEHVWNPERVLDEMLSLQFGTPHLKVHEPLRMPAGPGIGDTHALRRFAGAKGRWRLSVDGDWTVTANGFTCGRPDADTSDNTKCLQRFADRC